MDELFPINSITKDSPRLAWLKKYRIKTKEWHDPEWDDEKWFAWSLNDCEFPECDEDCTFGATEHEAIAQWAIEAHVRLWNEQALPDAKRY